MERRERWGRRARAAAVVGFLASFFPCATYQTHLRTDTDDPTTLVFLTGSAIFGVLCLMTLLMIALGRGDESAPRKAALAWWVAGLCSVLLQVLVIMQLSPASRD